MRGLVSLRWAQLERSQQRALGILIIVTGGYHQEDGGLHVLRSAEMYDSESNIWSAIASMGTARRGHAAAVVDTRVFVVGGKDRDE
eukprot:SAG22_NODE_21371_length_257_cov_1.126582_1_plen_85_part_11